MLTILGPATAQVEIESDSHRSSAYPNGEELFRVNYMGIYGLDGRSRAPMDGFMASRIIDTE